MLIKKIVLKNFRQYIDTTIEFSTDPTKNITIVMGDNGTGKTTLAQAFQWALYGDTGFNIKELINRKVREQMTNGVRKSVSVSLDIIFNNMDYTITRQVVYVKTGNERIEEIKPAKFTIAYINSAGSQEYIPEYQKEYFIKRILPRDLSKFFFFDGEKIEEMAENIQSGKGEDFKEAVYSLIGLGAIQNAIEHLGSQRKKSVIKVFKEELDKNSSSIAKVNEYNNEIQKYNSILELGYEQRKNLQSELEKIEKAIEKNQAIILQETQKMQLKDDYEKLEKEVNKLKKTKSNKIGKDLIRDFRRGFYGFAMTPVMANEDVHNLLELSAPEKKTINGLTKKTIEHLLSRGTCLCGTCLSEDSEAYRRVEELLEFSYPKTIGMLKDEYLKAEKSIQKEGKDYFDTMQSRMREVSELNAQIEAKEMELAEKMNMLANTSKGEEAKAELARNKQLKATKSKELINCEASIKDYERLRDRKETEKEKLHNVDNITSSLQRYLAYAQAIHKKLKTSYDAKEKTYRFKLERGMNEIFETIYDGNIDISIDDKYRILVSVDEEYSSDDEVERNTAQSYALIFAFIAAVIDLAKKKVNEDAMSDLDKIDVENEGYPLVMDAPLSAFDTTRIKSICTEIPKIADQVIMFIKDTDGNVAEEYMSGKIGCRYNAVKVNGSNLESQVVKEEDHV